MKVVSMAEGQLTAEDSGVLSAVRKLTPQIAERTDEIEEKRCVPPDLIQGLADAGAFRMFVPREYGGEELDPVTAFQVIEEVAKADGSAGWNVMVNADFAPFLARFPRETLDELYGSGPDAYARGALAPKGVAVKVDGGYIAQGRWPLASGSYEHRWAVGNCIVLEDGKPRMKPTGIPEMRLVIVPAESAEIISTWDAVGMRGTGSDDIVISEQFVPERRAADVFESPTTLESVLYSIAPRTLLGPTHVAVVVGIAHGAIDEIAELAKTKRPAFNPAMRLATDPVFQHKLGQLRTRLAAVRSLILDYAERVWDSAVRGQSLAPEVVLTCKSAVTYGHTECVAIVNEAFAMAGSSAIYSSAALQRRWRDVRVAAQHAAASDDIYRFLGAFLAGEELPPGAVD